MATTTLSAARVLRRPRHLDRRAVLGVFLLLAAVGGSLAFWSASSATTSVLVATHDLPSGATISTSDLAVARVRVDDAVYQAAIPASDLSSIVGRQLSTPIYAHQLLVHQQLLKGLPFGRNQMAFTIAVSADTAAGGRIQPRDVVEVLLTTGKGTSNPSSTVVLPRVTVFDIGYGSSTTTIGTTSSAVSGGSSAQGSISWVTLIVTQPQALRLAHAKWAGQLDVALRPGR